MKVLRGRYKIIEVLGQGGMGVVYRAEDEQLGRTVALKALSPEVCTKEAVEIFKTEAKVMASLKHPNLLGVYDVLNEEGQAYLVMEYVDGITVEDIIDDTGKENRLVDLDDGVDIATQLLVALSYLEERNVVHRDIKPSNMMLDQNGVLKLMDFGLARDIDRMVQKGTRVRGTPAYMSPEQVTGETLSPSSDIYSTGATLFELFTGRLPFETGELTFHQVFTEAPDPRELRPDIPHVIANLITQSMAKDPAHRPASARMLLFDLIEELGERERPFPSSVRSQCNIQAMSLSSMRTKTVPEVPPCPEPNQMDKHLSKLKIGVGVVSGVILALIVTLGVLLWVGPEGSDQVPTTSEAMTVVVDGTKELNALKEKLPIQEADTAKVAASDVVKDSLANAAVVGTDAKAETDALGALPTDPVEKADTKESGKTSASAASRDKKLAKARKTENAKMGRTSGTETPKTKKRTEPKEPLTTASTKASSSKPVGKEAPVAKKAPVAETGPKTGDGGPTTPSAVDKASAPNPTTTTETAKAPEAKKKTEEKKKVEKKSTTTPAVQKKDDPPVPYGF